MVLLFVSTSWIVLTSRLLTYAFLMFSSSTIQWMSRRWGSIPTQFMCFLESSLSFYAIATSSKNISTSLLTKKHIILFCYWIINQPFNCIIFLSVYPCFAWITENDLPPDNFFYKMFVIWKPLFLFVVGKRLSLLISPYNTSFSEFLKPIAIEINTLRSPSLLS